MILSLRTDKPEAEIGLFDGDKQLAHEKWQAHRKLAETIHQKMDELLENHDRKLSDIDGIIIYKGPGSFTGLRIGMSVANALAYSLDVPVASATGGDWAAKALQDIKRNPSKKPVMPEYGSPVHITTPKK